MKEVKALNDQQLVNFVEQYNEAGQGNIMNESRREKEVVAYDLESEEEKRGYEIMFSIAVKELRGKVREILDEVKSSQRVLTPLEVKMIDQLLVGLAQVGRDEYSRSRSKDKI